MLELATALLAVVVAAALLLRFVIRVVVVHDYQRGVRFRNGRLSGLLSTGTHVAIRPFSDIELIDGRPTAVTLAPQQILTSDGVAVGVTLVARYVVVDPVTAVTGDQSWPAALEGSLGAALRTAVAGRTVDDLLAARASLGPAVAGVVASDVARIGVELLAVDVGDVVVPDALKQAAVGVLAARRDAEAAMERARGEAASLRTLAEAAPLLEEHPGLKDLRAMQGGPPGARAADPVSADDPAPTVTARRPGRRMRSAGSADGAGSAIADPAPSVSAAGSNGTGPTVAEPTAIEGTGTGG